MPRVLYQDQTYEVVQKGKTVYYGRRDGQQITDQEINSLQSRVAAQAQQPRRSAPRAQPQDPWEKVFAYPEVDFSGEKNLILDTDRMYGRGENKRRLPEWKFSL